VLLDQHLHRSPQRLRLLPVEARGEDVALELLRRNRKVVLRRAVLREQLVGDAVHVDVRRLRRQDHRHEQLDRILEPQRDLRVCVLDCKALDDRTDARTLRAHALPRLVNVATRHEPTLTDPR
jgi:hypothetical protein